MAPPNTTVQHNKHCWRHHHHHHHTIKGNSLREFPPKLLNLRASNFHSLFLMIPDAAPPLYAALPGLYLLLLTKIGTWKSALEFWGTWSMHDDIVMIHETWPNYFGHLRWTSANYGSATHPIDTDSDQARIHRPVMARKCSLGLFSVNSSKCSHGRAAKRGGEVSQSITKTLTNYQGCWVFQCERLYYHAVHTMRSTSVKRWLRQGIN